MVTDGCAQRAFSGGQASTSRMRGRAALHSYHGHSRRSWRCRAGSKDADDASGDGRGVSEDVLAKLRAFEEENRKLKDRLKEKVQWSNLRARAGASLAIVSAQPCYFLAQPHTFAASMHMELRPTQGVSAAQPAAVLNNAHVQSICLQLLT